MSQNATLCEQVLRLEHDISADLTENPLPDNTIHHYDSDHFHLFLTFDEKRFSDNDIRQALEKWVISSDYIKAIVTYELMEKAKVSEPGVPESELIHVYENGISGRVKKFHDRIFPPIERKYFECFTDLEERARLDGKLESVSEEDIHRYYNRLDRVMKQYLTEMNRALINHFVSMIRGALSKNNFDNINYEGNHPIPQIELFHFNNLAPALRRTGANPVLIEIAKTAYIKAFVNSDYN